MSRRRVALLAALAVALSACGGSGTPSALRPEGSEARHLADVWWLLFGAAVVTYVTVAGFVLFAAVRRGDPDDRRRPRDTWLVVLGGVVVPAAVLAGIGVVTVRTTQVLRVTSDAPVRVEIVGRRWWWEVRYPDEGVVTANELHLPVGRPVDITLTSDDVIHSFWVPQLAGKEDAIPGQVNHLRFTPEKTGRYRGLCAEFCGLQHANMQALVFVDDASTFGRWLAGQQTPAPEPSGEEQALGRVVFEREACSGCHTVRGTSARGGVGPDLTHVGSRTTLAGVTIENTPEQMRRWIENPGNVKPGVLMPPVPLSQRDLSAVVSYLQSLR